MKSEKKYIDLYHNNRELIARLSAKVMNDRREKAFLDFQHMGFPSKKMERYKYTDIDSLFAPNYHVNFNRTSVNVNPYEAFSCDIPNLSTSLFFVVNDTLYTKKKLKGVLPEGIIIDSLSHAAVENSSLIDKFYGHLAKTEDDALTALNTMLVQDGLFVYIPKSVKIDRAIQVVNIQRADADTMINRRVLIVVDDDAEAKLLFCDDNADDHRLLCTQVIEAYVGNNASLDLYCLEETTLKNTRISNVYIEQQRNSRVSHNVITLHNGYTRNKLDLTFRGEGAECWCNGCAIADKGQHVDNNTLIDHAVGHCTSHELYKYVLNGQAVGAFAGRVLVRHDAQKTSSEERNQNLIMSQTARMYTQPMLEIYADDVKCSHGSSVGQLNDAARFYMQQRGIDEHEANLLLEFAFVDEVINEIKLQPLRDRLHQLIEKRFRGELDKCYNCRIRK